MGIKGGGGCNALVYMGAEGQIILLALKMTGSRIYVFSLVNKLHFQKKEGDIVPWN